MLKSFFQKLRSGISARSHFGGSWLDAGITDYHNPFEDSSSGTFELGGRLLFRIHNNHSTRMLKKTHRQELKDLKSKLASLNEERIRLKNRPKRTPSDSTLKEVEAALASVAKTLRSV